MPCPLRRSDRGREISASTSPNPRLNRAAYDASGRSATKRLSASSSFGNRKTPGRLSGAASSTTERRETKHRLCAWGQDRIARVAVRAILRENPRLPRHRHRLGTDGPSLRRVRSLMVAHGRIECAILAPMGCPNPGPVQRDGPLLSDMPSASRRPAVRVLCTGVPPRN